MHGISMIFVLLAVSLLNSCASSGPIPPASAAQAIEATNARAVVVLGPFLDRREGTGGDQRYVGTVRGGFGNPWERLYLEEGVPAFVADNIKKCLWYSKIATVVLDPKNEVFYDGHFMLKKLSDNISSPPVLAGLIRSVQAKNSAFGGSRYFEVLIDLYLINQETGKIIWQGIIANNTNHLKYTDEVGIVGISGNLEPTRQWLASLIQDKGVELFANLNVKEINSKR